ncbi:unnamed protein product [Heterobilharzia americana]|nr:unnamed protein product [Heterobilharzia americana]
MIRLRSATKFISVTGFTRHTISFSPTLKTFSTSVVLCAPTSSFLPEPPSPPTNEPVLNILGEPTFSSLGLNSYWPSGWYQSLLEVLHVQLNLPWWGAIAITTVIIRLCLFPIIIQQRRHLAKFTESMPKYNILQERLTQARFSGNYVEAMRTSQEMQTFMRTNNLNPLKTFKYMIFQIPVFLSVFTGIRGLVNLPVVSMQTGGIGWFTDLTLADPYYILPFLSMASLILTFEYSGSESPSSKSNVIIRNTMRTLPFIGFFFVMNMPSALVWYWTISNALSLIQSLILRQSIVKSYFNIPIQAPIPVLKKKRDFISGFKESLNNSRLLAELEARERLDAKNWQDAGRKSAPVTFISNPTELKITGKNG